MTTAIILNIYIFICLAALGLLWHLESFFVAHGLSSCFSACGILFHRPGIKAPSSTQEGGYLTTGRPVKSQ